MVGADQFLKQLRSVGSESIGQAIIAGRSLDVRRQHDECPIWLSMQVWNGLGITDQDRRVESADIFGRSSMKIHGHSSDRIGSRTRTDAVKVLLNPGL